jgi:hypothetical protein
MSSNNHIIGRYGEDAQALSNVNAVAPETAGSYYIATGYEGSVSAAFVSPDPVRDSHPVSEHVFHK